MKAFSQVYLKLLMTELKGLNLTNILTPEEFYIRQILDSYCPLDKSKKFSEVVKKVKLLLDIGFGGGFPILPLAKKMPSIQFIGLEARAKKARAVRFLAKELGLENVTLYHQRIEEVLLNRPAVLTLKAVGPIEDFLRKINFNCEVYCFFYKGPRVKTLEKVAPPQGWRMIEDISYSLPGEVERTFLGYQSIAPIGAKKIKQSKGNISLVSLSELA